MRITVEFTESSIRTLIAQKLEKDFNIAVDVTSIDILVKSKQNYKAEWEKAAFKATFIHNVVSDTETYR